MRGFNLYAGGNANQQRNRVRRNTQPAPTCGCTIPIRTDTFLRREHSDLIWNGDAAQWARRRLNKERADGLFFVKTSRSTADFAPTCLPGTKRRRAPHAHPQKVGSDRAPPRGRLQLSRRAERDFLRKGGTVERATDYL